LLSHEECAAKYATLINVDKPASSQGLTTADATRIATQTGLNVLSPPKKRHPILKYFDCLMNLFNILLVFAGVLNYILLAIDFQANFANVS
jgi:sodium/potassium-transporting ATPase subunit alpha